MQNDANCCDMSLYKVLFRVGWGGSCRGRVSHAGVGWIMQGWGGSCRGGVGHVGVGWVM